MSVRRRTGDRAFRSLSQHNVGQLCAQQQVLPTDPRSRHGIPSIPHSVQSLHGEFREHSVVVCTKSPSMWLRYVDDTFVKIHEYDVDGFTAHINSIDHNIQFTTEPELNNKLKFLDLCIHIHIRTNGYTEWACTCGPETEEENEPYINQQRQHQTSLH